MNAVSDILRQVPMDQLARQLGTDEATAESAARQAVASLMGGMQNNASDDRGAQSLAGALQDHSSSPFITRDKVDLDEVDTDEGEKIVGHVLGDEQRQLQALSSGGGGGLLNSPQARQLLKTLAPIVLAYLAGQVTSGKYGNVLGDILGGGDQGTQQPQEGGGIGDILGDVLGGGSSRQRTGSGGVLGGILGSILGGGR